MIESDLYLFIMGHPRSGSTIMHRLLSSSQNVSTLPDEGLKLITEINNGIDFRNRWDPKFKMDFQKIKEEWHIYWDKNKNILLEKSPPLILRSDELALVFNYVRFIWLIRNPYAYVASVKSYFPLSSAYFIAKFWCVMAMYIMQGFQRHRDKSILIKYEDFTSNLENFNNLICSFMPGIGQLKVNAIYNIKNKKSKITNLNDEYVNKLHVSDIFLISQALIPNHKIMNYFKYEIILTKANKFKTFIEKLTSNNCHHAKLLSNFNLKEIGII